MKKLLLIIIICMSTSIVSYLLISAQDTEEKPEPKKKEKTSIEASGAALWNHLKKADYAKKWKKWPGKTALYPGTEPHGALLTIYVNAPACRADERKKGMLPNGTIVVEEDYSPDKKLTALTVMYKVTGYNPEANDWFWAKYSPDGKIEAEGKVETCIICHGKKKDKDYIMTGPLMQQQFSSVQNLSAVKKNSQQDDMTDALLAILFLCSPGK